MCLREQEYLGLTSGIDTSAWDKHLSQIFLPFVEEEEVEVQSDEQGLTRL